MTMGENLRAYCIALAIAAILFPALGVIAWVMVQTGLVCDQRPVSSMAAVFAVGAGVAGIVLLVATKVRE